MRIFKTFQNILIMLVYNPQKGEFEERSNSSTPKNIPTSNNSNDNSGCWWIVGIIAVCTVGVFLWVNSCNNSESYQDVEEVVEEITPTEEGEVEKYLSVSTENLQFDSDGGVEVINIETNGDWSIGTQTESWGHLSKNGNQLHVRIDENPEHEERTDYFTIIAGDKERRVNITQSGAKVSWEVSGSSRDYIDNAPALTYITTQLKEKKECRLGAITENGKGIVIYGNNGYCFRSIPDGMSETIKELNSNQKTISSVTLTGSGYYCVVYGRNGWSGVVPDGMKEYLNKYNENREEIKCVSICENGNYAIVTDEHFIASNSSDYSNMKSAQDKYGYIKDVCLTDKGICVVCQNGIYYDNIPLNLEMELKSVDFHPDHVTFTDSGTYLITTESGAYSYNM